jgi:hypothetical protein
MYSLDGQGYLRERECWNFRLRCRMDQKRLSLHTVVRREKGEGKRYGIGGTKYAYYFLALHKMNRMGLV